MALRADGRHAVRAKPRRSAGSGGPATTDEQAALTSRRRPASRARLTRRRCAGRGRSRRGSPCRGRAGTGPRGAAAASSPASPTGAARTTSTWTATLEQLTEHPDARGRGHRRARAGHAPRRSVVLLVDVSGSMRGERVRTAAATVGALAAELAARRPRGDRVLVRRGRARRRLGQRRAAGAAAGRRCCGSRRAGSPTSRSRCRWRGASWPAFPPRDARVLLLSDCVHNAGPDPRPLAARLPRLDVLLDTTGEQDPELARDLAGSAAGGCGRSAPTATWPRPSASFRIRARHGYCHPAAPGRRRRAHSDPACPRLERIRQ